MKLVHVECKPDELLVSKLGFKRKLITHHQGKSRIFHSLGKTKNQLAIVDEDPGSIKTKYESSLQFITESEGIIAYRDNSGNKVLVLKGKLEDWIIAVCKKYRIKILDFGLPDRPNDLHDVVNQRLDNFGRLLDELLKNNIQSLITLKEFLR